MAANGTTAPPRSASEYSEVQASRLRVSLPLPEVLKNSFKVVDGPPSSAAGNPGSRFYFSIDPPSAFCMPYVSAFSDSFL